MSFLNLPRPCRILFFVTFQAIRRRLLPAFENQDWLAKEIIKNDRTIDDTERIGGHAVNICEWIEFCETGKMKNVRLI